MVPALPACSEAPIHLSTQTHETRFNDDNSPVAFFLAGFPFHLLPRRRRSAVRRARLSGRKPEDEYTE